MDSHLKPETPYTINPLDTKHPLLFFQDETHTRNIKTLTIWTEGASGQVRADFLDFLERLCSVERLVIRWKALDWLSLRERELKVFLRLFSLPSMQDLKILSSTNFPLGFLRYFTGRKLCIAAPTIPTALMPVFPSDMEQPRTGVLTHLSLVSTRCIREFRAFMDWRWDNASASLRSLECLGLKVDWRDEGAAAPADFLREIGSLLQNIGSISGGLRELHISDWRIDPFSGHQFTRRDLAFLNCLRRLDARIGAAPQADERTMDTMDSSLRQWLFPFLINLPSPRLLERLDIAFSFIVPFPWPNDLHEWMQKFCAELDNHLASSFPELKIVNFTFDLRNAHTRTYDWAKFNRALQPVELKARGVTCAFAAKVYNP